MLTQIQADKKARFQLKNLASEEGDEKLFVGLKGFGCQITAHYLIHRCTGLKFFSENRRYRKNTALPPKIKS